MNTDQARVVDPVLTNHVRGYAHPDRVGMALFPEITVNARGGKRIEFGKESFRLYNTSRAPGDNTKRVQFGYEGEKFALTDHSLEGQVPIEIMQDAAAVPNIDLASEAVDGVVDILGLELEHQQATLARDAANYGADNKVTLTSDAQWSNFGETSDPGDDIEVAREAIRSATGMYPNVMILGAQVFSKLRQHPDVIERIKYTGRDSATPDMLAGLYDVPQVLVGRSIYASGADDDFTDVWGKDVILAYTAGRPGRRVPSFGYTHRLRGYMLVEQAYYERGPKSWIYPVADSRSPEIVGADAGFLIKNAVA